MLMPKVTIYLKADVGHVGWRGEGWYWIDPEFLAGRRQDMQVTGPYASEELATAEFRAYCEIMTT